MKHPHTMAMGALAFCLLLLLAGTASAMNISGTISSTLTITENSKLVGDVVCTVTGAACISLGASGLTLDLNGYTITGLADPLVGCSSGPNPGPGEAGVLVNALDNIVIRGLGLIQGFRQHGVVLNNSNGSTVTGVTLSTNCFSGIFVVGGSDHLLEGNTSLRNGNPANPCGGI
jgi:hypothetical protein